MTPFQSSASVPSSASPVTPTLSPQEAVKNLEAVAHKKWYNRLIVNEKTGKLEQVIFFKAWGEDLKRLRKPSLTDNRLIKLKALQLLVSLGKDKDNLIADVKALAYHTGLTTDKELELQTVVKRVAATALSEAESEEIDTALTNALGKYQVRCQQELGQYFPPEILNLQERTSEVAHGAIWTMMKPRIVPSNVDESQYDVDKDYLDGTKPTESSVGSHVPEEVIKPLETARVREVEPLNAKQTQGGWSNLSKISACVGAALVAVGAVYYAFQSAGAGSPFPDTKINLTDQSLSPTHEPKEPFLTPPPTPFANVHPPAPTPSSPPPTLGGKHTVRELADALKNDAHIDLRHETGEAERVFRDNTTQVSHVAKEASFVSRHAGKIIGAFGGMLGIGGVAVRRLRGKSKVARRVRASRPKVVPRVDSKASAAHARAIEHQERLARGEKNLLLWLRDDAHWIQRPPLEDHKQALDNFVSFINRKECDLQKVLPTIYELESRLYYARYRLAQIPGDKGLKQLQDLQEVLSAVESYKERYFEEKMNSLSHLQDGMNLIQRSVGPQSVIPVDYKIALLELLDKGRKVILFDRLFQEYITSMAPGADFEELHEDFQNILSKISENIGWDGDSRDKLEAFHLWAVSRAARIIPPSSQIRTSFESLISGKSLIHLVKRAGEVLPKEEQNLVVNQDFVWDLEQNLYVKSQWEAVDTGYVWNGGFAVKQKDGSFYKTTSTYSFNFTNLKKEDGSPINEKDKQQIMNVVLSLYAKQDNIPDMPNLNVTSRVAVQKEVEQFEVAVQQAQLAAIMGPPVPDIDDEERKGEGIEGYEEPFEESDSRDLTLLDEPITLPKGFTLESSSPSKKPQAVAHAGKPLPPAKEKFQLMVEGQPIADSRVILADESKLAPRNDDDDGGAAPARDLEASPPLARPHPTPYQDSRLVDIESEFNKWLDDTYYGPDRGGRLCENPDVCYKDLMGDVLSQLLHAVDSGQIKISKLLEQLAQGIEKGAEYYGVGLKDGRLDQAFLEKRVRGFQNRAKKQVKQTLENMGVLKSPQIRGAFVSGDEIARLLALPVIPQIDPASLKNYAKQLINDILTKSTDGIAEKIAVIERIRARFEDSILYGVLTDQYKDLVQQNYLHVRCLEQAKHAATSVAVLTPQVLKDIQTVERLGEKSIDEITKKQVDSHRDQVFRAIRSASIKFDQLEKVSMYVPREHRAFWKQWNELEISLAFYIQQVTRLPSTIYTKSMVWLQGEENAPRPPLMDQDIEPFMQIWMNEMVKANYRREVGSSATLQKIERVIIAKNKALLNDVSKDARVKHLVDDSENAQEEDQKKVANKNWLTSPALAEFNTTQLATLIDLYQLQILFSDPGVQNLFLRNERPVIQNLVKDIGKVIQYEMLFRNKTRVLERTATSEKEFCQDLKQIYLDNQFAKEYILLLLNLCLKSFFIEKMIARIMAPRRGEDKESSLLNQYRLHNANDVVKWLWGGAFNPTKVAVAYFGQRLSRIFMQLDTMSKSAEFSKGKGDLIEIVAQYKKEFFASNEFKRNLESIESAIGGRNWFKGLWSDPSKELQDYVLNPSQGGLEQVRDTLANDPKNLALVDKLEEEMQKYIQHDLDEEEVR